MLAPVIPADTPRHPCAGRRRTGLR